MTVDILFVQGGGRDVHDQWDARLVARLKKELGPGYSVRYPRMPDEADPHYPPWRDALRNEVADLQDGVLLIGHSIGGAILIHTLADQLPRRKLGGVFLIATPFIGDGGWPSDEISSKSNLADHLPADVPFFLYHGTHDEVVPFEHLRLYESAMPHALARPLDGADHQLNGDLSCVAQDIFALKLRG
ncbi:alpha/beta fold hydrolase [Dyella mobilis]|uniref:Alpha/beta fold hydrolase n=1 Tax=Dyella mobilis TaxID=1849582 RepID=A0ABS2KDA0_9GAMM|nr:alpha/beta fold hydrolase [Dyella mobilis]MBM7129020.1 alpha/beta fold hydrolase [Dyella mobilis]GLQ99286.1 alpha/beta hydrolase [Dyella mobilis]